MSVQNYYRLTAAFLLLLLLSACSVGKQPAKMNYGLQGEDKTDSERSYQTQQLVGPVTHNNSLLSYSQSLSNIVAAANGVNAAIVMTTDQRAYVAVMMDSTATGTKGKTRETNNQGTVTGIYNPDTPESDSMDPNKLNNGANNAETAIHHDLLAHRFKQVLADKIRYSAPYLQDVYISANRDFVNEMNRYAQESWKGNSLQPYLLQFNKLVTDVFGTEQVPPPQPAAQR
ncbi:hypothetical protein [Paenibacillus eucommiae]|uniref:YhcN/YlaJ family sporulation lipoprotein n=1 Tax=Paenibacillus eucommiae TaxID=1355755 RepID=A0ABS4IY12_9BACL|nr:hypothetical protein [Paenibacillus eucommiae]MBP1992445.1 YhcN/YlaJ family sporulation lipoprotein [Paenibacillus eucommiae]